jgi:hypothetical protein
MTLSRFLRAVSAVVLVGLFGGQAGAQQTLYGVTYGGSQLITINTTTGAGTVVATLSPSFTCAGLSFRAGRLYGVDASAPVVREINTTTGAVVNTVNLGAVITGEGDIAFRSDGIGFLCPFGPDPLVRFDITVPSSTVIGPLNPNVTLDAMAFSPADVLYGISQSAVGGQGSDTVTRLYTINQATGVMTLVGPTTGVNGNSGGGMAFDSSGTLYAALNTTSSGPSSLYRINTSTGAATLIGPIGFTDVTGLAFQGGGGGGGGGSGGGTGNEGSYGGSSSGQSGGEGSFGFGGRNQRSVLLGPFAQNAGHHTVLNVAFRQAESQLSDQANGPTLASLLSILLVALVAVPLGVKIVRTLLSL